MSYNDNPVLVAPRPVRLTGAAPTPSAHVYRPHAVRLVSAPADHFERMRIGEELENNDPRDSSRASSVSPDKDLSSPRASPRTALPSEALEEFLSILRPSFFPPSSPILQTRRYGNTTMPNFSYAYKPRIELVSPKVESPTVEEIGRAISAQRKSPEPSSGGLDSDRRWISSAVLSSPVSRTHTRNPFQRHPSYQASAARFSPSNMLLSPDLSSSALSPAAIPLPLPTPDEMMEVA
ncbi:hypothetical protein PLICRDRAFT_176241 [Plicaturopsis crispa FD-325 SS-3]|nr:hypothetical protein PLICRDRAFT_176241 [Plicaturopsis crispa FD-325 SS-3]